MTYAHSLIGMYIIQALLHSFLALILVELSFSVWEIRDHLSKFRYRLLPLTLPFFMFPLYQFISPERGSWHFRFASALFDSQKWLDIQMLGIFPFSVAVLLFLAGISALFMWQEILPLFRMARVSPEYEECELCEVQLQKVHEVLDPVCRTLGTTKPSFMVIDEPLPVLFMQGFKNYHIVISSHLIETLEEEELEGALIHEVVHMVRNSNIKTQIIYLFRMLMFYNPISLVEFRRIVHDDEFICDAMTVSLTRNPEALIGAISAFYSQPESGAHGLSQMKERVESHSHNLMLDERIEKLKEKTVLEQPPFRWAPFLLTLFFILLIGYVVV